MKRTLLLVVVICVCLWITADGVRVSKGKRRRRRRQRRNQSPTTTTPITTVQKVDNTLFPALPSTSSWKPANKPQAARSWLNVAAAGRRRSQSQGARHNPSAAQQGGQSNGKSQSTNTVGGRQATTNNGAHSQLFEFYSANYEASTKSKGQPSEGQVSFECNIPGEPKATASTTLYRVHSSRRQADTDMSAIFFVSPKTGRWYFCAAKSGRNRVRRGAPVLRIRSSKIGTFECEANRAVSLENLPQFDAAGQRIRFKDARGRLQGAFRSRFGLRLDMAYVSEDVFVTGSGAKTDPTNPNCVTSMHVNAAVSVRSARYSATDSLTRVSDNFHMTQRAFNTWNKAPRACKARVPGRVGLHQDRQSGKTYFLVGGGRKLYCPVFKEILDAARRLRGCKPMSRHGGGVQLFAEDHQHYHYAPGKPQQVCAVSKACFRNPRRHSFSQRGVYDTAEKIKDAFIAAMLKQ